MLTEAMECFCLCLLCPCFVTVNTVLVSSSYISRQKASWKNDVRSLPSRRRRLSILGNYKIGDGCIFLTKLPLEIRLAIYKYVLGGHLLHLVQIPRRIAHVRCRYDDKSDSSRSCRPSTLMPLNGMLRSVSSADLALTKTCRQIYVEALPILYTSNVFDVNHPSTFRFFTRSILAQRLAAITSMHLCFSLSEMKPRYGYKSRPAHLAFQRDWKKSWHVIAKEMPGLRDLDVVLKNADAAIVPFALDESWVAPILQLRGLRHFEIYFAEASDRDAAAAFGLNIKRFVMRDMMARMALYP